MKKIYIVVTFTGTLLSRVIKIYTQNNYTHVSISLDKRLKKMYSFGRLNAYIPFIGGFVHEHPKKGTFRRFKNTLAEIYELDVTYEQYKIIKNTIKDIKKHKHKYTFNIPGLFATVLNLKINKEYCFYCAEFVKHVLEKANVKNNLPKVIKPQDFVNMKNIKLVYKGLLREYK